MLTVAGCGHKSDNDAKAEADVADTALNSGTPDVALRLADAALTRDPANVEALTRRGLALTELGRLAEARESLQKAVAGQPRDSRALIALGRVQLPVDPAAAAANFELVVKQEAHNAIALNDLGIARNLLGRHTEAEAAYRSALSAQPDMTAAQVNLALCLGMLGHGDEAIRLLRPLADSPDATRKVREDYAAVLAMSGQREEAEHIMAANVAANDVAQALDMLASARTVPATTR